MFFTWFCMILYFSMSVWSLLPVEAALVRDSGYAPLAAYRCVRWPWLVPAVWPLSDYPASEVGADSWWVVPQGLHPRFCANDAKELGSLFASPFSGDTLNAPWVLRDRLDTWQFRDTLWIRITHTLRHSYWYWYWYSIVLAVLICIAYSSASSIVYTFVLLKAWGQALLEKGIM